jgi:hypothetical protein
MKPSTVILFGTPKIGTAPMQKAATLAIDNPPKALVWEDDNGKVWLSYNSGEYLESTGLPSSWPYDAAGSGSGYRATSDGRERSGHQMSHEPDCEMGWPAQGASIPRPFWRRDVDTSQSTADFT